MEFPGGTLSDAFSTALTPGVLSVADFISFIVRQLAVKTAFNAAKSQPGSRCGIYRVQAGASFTPGH